MRTNDPLRLPLSIAATYVLLVGAIQLIPSLAETVFSRPVVDPAVESLYGTGLLAIGAITAILASQRVRSTAMLWAVVGAFVIAAVDLVVYWSMGEYTARTALVPILINLALAGWITSLVVRAGVPGTQTNRV